MKRYSINPSKEECLAYINQFESVQACIDECNKVLTENKEWTNNNPMCLFTMSDFELGFTIGEHNIFCENILAFIKVKKLDKASNNTTH